MKSLFTLLSLTATVISLNAEKAEPDSKTQLEKNSVNQDSLIFRDGSNLFGVFQGIDKEGSIKWKRQSNLHSQSYPIKEISEFSIDGARPKINSSKKGLIVLTNGDSLPGEIQSITPAQLTLKTDFSQDLILPIQYISHFYPALSEKNSIVYGINPTQNWQIFRHSTSTNHQKKSLTKIKNPQWLQHGASLYALSKGYSYITEPSIKLPDNYSLRFSVSKRGNARINLVLNANMRPPISRSKVDEINKKNPDKPQLKVNRRSGNANTFGNCLVLQISGNHLSLFSHGVDDENQAFRNTCKSSAHNNYFREVPYEENHYQILCSKSQGIVTVYINNKKIKEWFLDESEFEKLGTNIAFFVEPYGSKGKIRISGLDIQRWSYVTEPLITLQHPEKDIILLNNGTDRFAGKISNFEPPHIHFKTDYTDLKINKSNIKSIYFSKKQQKEIPELKTSYQFNFFNNGKIKASILPQTEDNQANQTIQLKTSFDAIINLPIKHIQSVQFQPSHNLLKNWKVQN